MKNFEKGKKKKNQNRKYCHDNLKSFGHFQLKTDFHLDKNQGENYNSTIARVWKLENKLIFLHNEFFIMLEYLISSHGVGVLKN